MKSRQRAFASLIKTCVCCFDRNISSYRINRFYVLSCQRTWHSEEARSSGKNHKPSPEEFLLNLHNSRRREQKYAALILEKNDKTPTAKNEQTEEQAEHTAQSLHLKAEESTLANVEELFNDDIDDDKSDDDENNFNKSTRHEFRSEFVTDQFNDSDEKKCSWEDFDNETDYLATEPSISEELTLPITVLEEEELLKDRAGSSEDDLYLQNILHASQEGTELQEENLITGNNNVEPMEENVYVTDNNTDNKSDDNTVNLDSKLTSFELSHASSNSIDNNATENSVVTASAEDRQANLNTYEEFTSSVNEYDIDSTANNEGEVNSEINEKNDSWMESETRIEAQELNDIEESDASENELIDEMLASPLPSFTLNDLLHNLQQSKRSSDAHFERSRTSANSVKEKRKYNNNNNNIENSSDNYVGDSDDEDHEDESTELSTTFDNQEVTFVEVNSLGEGLQSKKN